MGNKIEEKQSFDNWSELKKEIHFTRQAPFFKEREIWWTSIGYNIGDEQNGKNDLFERPVLILRKFNNIIFLGLPLTSRVKEGIYYHQTICNEKPASIILSQARLLDGQRLLRKMDIIPENELLEIKNELINNVLLIQRSPAEPEISKPEGIL